MEVATMNKDELLLALCKRLIGDAEVVGEGPWSKVVMVGVVDKGSARLFGFTFDAQGDWEAAAPRGGDALDLLRELRDAMAASDAAKKPWVSCLLKIGSSGKVGAEFEYSDAARWAVTPANHAQRVAEFAAMPV